jgi:hypothetical protein
MIITAARNSAVIEGGGDLVDYKIDTANLGHIASILRKAYSDPIRAVVREYGTNACEAHMLNGNEKKPFEVTLPTSLAPTFKLRDFGPGLGVESFKDLFCSYGGSSKRTSNQFTGCLGIGCKSYGSYTDSCTVTDIHNGTKRIWNCYIDESEVGKATLLSETKTNEPSGVEIAIAVRPTDVERFRATAIRVYKVFDVQPKLTSATAEEHEKLAKRDYREGSVKGSNWAFRGDINSWLQMGLVLYPLKADFAGPNSIKELINAGVYVRVELGDVQIAPSREDLQYSQKTIQSLIKHLTPIVNTIGDELIKAVQGASDIIAAYQVVREFRRHGEYGSSNFREAIIKKIRPKLLWKGIPLNSDFELPLAEMERNAKGDVTKTAKAVLEEHGITLLRISKRGWGKTKFNVDRDDWRIHVQEDMEVFFNDTKTGSGESRIRYWMTDGGGSKETTAYVISCKNGGKAWLETNLPWFQHVPFRSIEALPKPPAKTVVDENGDPVVVSKDRKHSRGTLFILCQDHVNQDKLSNHWNLGQAPDGETVFVRLSKFEWSMRLGCDNFKSDYGDLYGALEYLKSISPVKALYGVKIADEEAKRNDNLICFHEALDKYVRKFLAANPDKAQLIADRKAARVFFSYSSSHWGSNGWKNSGNFFETEDLFRWFESSKNKPSLISGLDPKSPFRVYMEHIYRMLGGNEQEQRKLPVWLRRPTGVWQIGRGEDSKEYKALFDLLPEPSFDLKKASKGLVERYPLFVRNSESPDMMRSHAFSLPTQASVEYVRLVDAARDGR